MKPRKKQIFKGENSATALVPLLPAALCALPLRQEGLRQRLWVLAASGNDTWPGGVSSILQRSKVGCLRVRIALPPSAGLHGDAGGREPGCGTRSTMRAAPHRTSPARNSCSVALGGRMYPIGRASLRDYTIFTANRYRKTWPETAQEQLAANESS